MTSLSWAPNKGYFSLALGRKYSSMNARFRGVCSFVSLIFLSCHFSQNHDWLCKDSNKKNWHVNKWIKLYQGLQCKKTDKNMRLKCTSIELEICSGQFEESWCSSWYCFTTKIKRHFLSTIHSKSQWLFPSGGFKWNVKLSLEVLLLGQLYCYRIIPITGPLNKPSESSYAGLKLP